MVHLRSAPETAKETAQFAPVPANRKRWTRDECEFLERVGFLPERYELLNGEIVLKVGQNQPHAMSVIRMVAWLLSVFGVEHVQTQTDIEVVAEDQPTNLPQPDVFVLSKPDYTIGRRPRGTELLLVVEVSDTTLRDDLQTKAGLYARAGVPEYWVLDVNGRRLFVHTNPAGGEYSQVSLYAEDEEVAPMNAPQNAQASIRVSALLPPAAASETEATAAE